MAHHLAQKTSKSRKTNRKMSKTARTRKKLTRSLALAISEPKLRRQRSKDGAITRAAKPLRAVEDRPLTAQVEVAAETNPLLAVPRPDTIFLWSPWNVMPRQQAFMAQALGTMMWTQPWLRRCLRGACQFVPFPMHKGRRKRPGGHLRYTKSFNHALNEEAHGKAQTHL
jgi:hypothetical protein